MKPVQTQHRLYYQRYGVQSGVVSSEPRHHDRLEDVRVPLVRDAADEPVEAVAHPKMQEERREEAIGATIKSAVSLDGQQELGLQTDLQGHADRHGKT